MKKITIALLIAILAGYIHMNVYTVKVTATNETITGINTNGESITLIDCRTENGERVLLENVKPGKQYNVLINNFGTWEKDDDEIIRIREAHNEI